MLAPLAQFVQSLTELVWKFVAVAVAGLVLPIVGWLMSLLRYGLRWPRAALTALFYALALPLGAYILLYPSDHAIDLCLILMLAPIGVFLGLGAVVRAGTEETETVRRTLPALRVRSAGDAAAMPRVRRSPVARGGVVARERAPASFKQSFASFRFE